ncbi:ATP-dependent DNA helicase sgs1 [Steccherinum ochraceum]|uniref:ATP-dependent DNA helicase sgs1 n=1 Tax=Steccherinum ochraceum TaxID=92696 RepID=A0A4V2MXQ2_9APHY|nr:ATP-dependent DNA helicase sgs1 [Steccherinum ochraceum]
MASFSWSDTIQAAFAPCLACLQRGPQLPDDSDSESQSQSHSHHQQHARIPRARADELEGLLADSDDAETLSLHSNPGDRRRKRKQKSKKGIKLFGFDLFGKAPPIHLTDDEGEGGEGSGRRPHRREGSQSQAEPRVRANDERSRTISTDTLDSDAALLDPATIDELSAARLAESVRREEEERRLKEERRKLRRERKELKKAAMQLALAQAESNGGPAGFEGFQGSGPEYGHIPSPFRQYAGSASDISSPHTIDEFGPFEQGQHFSMPAPLVLEHSEEADLDGADFGAENYARRVPGGSSNGAGSDSRSGTSASMSNTGYNPGRYNISQQPLSNGQAPFSPLSPQGEQGPYGDDATPTRRKKSRKSGRHSVSSTSQSTGPVSPPPHAQTFVPQPIIAGSDTGYEYQRPNVVPEGVEAFVDRTAPSAGFPSTGLRGGMSRKNSEAGVFLARRGD